MDNNTHDVLMAGIALISAIVTPIVIVVVNNRTNKKLDDNFKQANGHFTKLLDTTAKLSKEEGREEQRHESDNKGNESIPRNEK